MLSSSSSLGPSGRRCFRSTACASCLHDAGKLRGSCRVFSRRAFGRLRSGLRHKLSRKISLLFIPFEAPFLLRRLRWGACASCRHHGGGLDSRHRAFWTACSMGSWALAFRFSLLHAPPGGFSSSLVGLGWEMLPLAARLSLVSSWWLDCFAGCLVLDSVGPTGSFWVFLLFLLSLLEYVYNFSTSGKVGRCREDGSPRQTSCQSFGGDDPGYCLLFFCFAGIVDYHCRSCCF